LLSEITRSYLVLILAAGTFGLVSVACSSYFRRTSSALVVSYLVILPLAVMCVVLTGTDNVQARDFVSIAILPPWCLAAWTVLGILVNRRLLHPPDVGSEGKDVIDEEEEMKYAIGVVIDRDLFPDKLFAPAKRTDLMPDGTNPVLDKELRSEIFSQGTLMLRVVIQVSMLLSIPLMAALLFLRSDKAGYYVAYVLAFNMLVGPVFSAGSITQERERQTLSLLLTTLLRPGQIVYAKLMAALRVSTVLTFLYLTSRASAAVLDTARLLAHHRHHVHGNFDDWTLVLVTRAPDRVGDGDDVSDSAHSLRASARHSVVFANDRFGHRGATGRSHCHQPFRGGPGRSHAQHAHRSMDEPASYGRRADSARDHSLAQASRMGGLSLHLPATGPFVFLDHLSGIPVAMVASRGARLGLVDSHRRSGRAAIARQGAIFEIPHLIRPTHQVEFHRYRVNRAGLPLATYPDLQGKLDLDFDLARTLVGLEIGDLEDERRGRARMALAELIKPIFPVCFESFIRPVGRRDPAR
jgi:hypothetical protein